MQAEERGRRCGWGRVRGDWRGQECTVSGGLSRQVQEAGGLDLTRDAAVLAGPVRLAFGLAFESPVTAVPDHHSSAA